MSPNYYVEQFPSEKSWSDIRHIVLVVGLVEFFLFHLLTDRKRICTLFWGILPSNIESQLVKADSDQVKQEKRGDHIQTVMSGGDVDVVFRRLGLSSISTNGGGQARSLDADEVFDMFEEENPRLEEVKEAFDVFDEDRDGFIDAQELQKVLCALGFSEGLKVENCMRMIGVFDENGDGRIDFDEFVTFMESSPC